MLVKSFLVLFLKLIMLNDNFRESERYTLHKFIQKNKHKHYNHSRIEIYFSLEHATDLRK